MEIIKTIDLCKNFKEKSAVKNLSIHINENEIYGFLGLNGAGKTTTIKMLNGLCSVTNGDAIISGYYLSKNLDDIKRISSVSPQESAISMKLTVYENIMLMAKIHNFSKDDAKIKTDNIIKRFDLEEYKNTYASKLSGGYQRRLSIAMAIVSDPKILYLDEPTLGLDIIARRSLWKLIIELKKEMTIVLTTHYLEEIEALSDHLGIIKNGDLLFEGTTKELYEKTMTNNIDDAFVKICEE